MAKLEDLLVNEDEIDRNVLADGLAGYVAITAGGNPYPMAAWSELNERGKVIATLLAVRAAQSLGKRPSADLTPTELSRLSGVALGTAKRELRSLSDARLAIAIGRGRYSAAGPSVRRAIDEMRTGKRHG